MIHQCFTSFSQVFHECFNSVSIVFHWWFTSVSPVFHQCFTSVSKVVHQFFTSYSQVFNECFKSISKVFQAFVLKSRFAVCARTHLCVRLPNWIYQCFFLTWLQGARSTESTLISKVCDISLQVVVLYFYWIYQCFSKVDGEGRSS